MSEYSAKVYMEQGGDKLIVESGGAIEIQGGGAITIDGSQASAIADMITTYSSNDPSITPDGTITVADGGTPTVDELLEFCEELSAKLDAVLAALRGAGIIASS